MLIVGLTGSIATGKSTAGAMLRRRGVPVFDSDAAVHALYAGPLAAELDAAFPGVAAEGSVDRAKLAERVAGDSGALRRLEAIVHPHVADAEARFLADARAAGRLLAVLDIPLLLEVGAETRVHVVLVVSVDEDTQLARAMQRPDMTAEKFAALKARQIPDADKRRRAHFVVDTGFGLERTERDLDAILRAFAHAH